MGKNRLFLCVLLMLVPALVLCGCAADEPQSIEAPEQIEAEDPAPGSVADRGLPPVGEPVCVVLSPSAPGTEVEQTDSAIVDYSNAREGYIMAAWRRDADAKLKLLVRGPGGSTYQYNLRPDGEYEAFPLSDGSGEYTVGVYRNTEGTEYVTVLSCTMSVILQDEFAPFLRPNQYVSYHEDSEAVAKAAELCRGFTNNLDKVDVIYAYVIGNIYYDTEKARFVQSGYLPDVDETLASGKGICFDYAALMAAMLRCQGVPVKLVVGYTGDAYHAWLSVYSETDGWIEGKIFFDGQSWLLMDPTFASGSHGRDEVLDYIGNGSNYQAKYLY